MTRVLLTGASGFLGGHIAEALRARADLDVSLLVRDPSSDVGPLRLRSTTDDRLRDAGGAPFDVLLHVGSWMPRHSAEIDDPAGVAGTVGFTQRVLAELGPIGHVVFASTVDVYGPSTEVISETTCPHPAALYGSGKLFCEDLVLAYGRRTAARVNVLRLGHLFGPGEEAHRKLVPELIRAGLRGGPLTVRGNRGALRDLLFVADAASAVVRCIDSPAPATTMNVVSGQSHSIDDVARLVAGLTGSSVVYEDEHLPSHSLQFDAERIRQFMVDWPVVTLKAGLEWEVAAMRASIAHV